MPDTGRGYNKSLQPYAYDPEKAKSLLKEAGAEGMTLTFVYPSEVSRPYMPNPQKIHDALRSDLEAVGIKVNVVTKPWNGGYLDDVNNGQYDAWLLGWTGDYNAPDNFVGTFFGSLASNDFHTRATRTARRSPRTSSRPTPSWTRPRARRPTRSSTSRSSRSTSPACRSAHSPPALVVIGDVQGLVASPLTAETFNTVTVGGK